jgi:uncharacterized protein YndB with AHSA1/START domain
MRSLPAILLLILGVPALAIAYVSSGGPQSDPLERWFYAASLACIIPAIVLFVVSWMQKPASPVLNPAAIDRSNATAVIGMAFVIDGTALNPGVLWPLPVAGLPISALAIGWVIVWTVPQLRRSRIVTTFEVKRPPEAVFDFVSDDRNLPRWRTEALSSQLVTAEPVGPGSRFRQVVRLPRGKEVVAESEIVDYEPNHRVTSRVPNATAPSFDEITFDPTADGTRVTHRWDFEYSYPMAVSGGRLLEPLVRRQILKWRRAGVVRIKEILEAEPVQSAQLTPLSPSL